MDRRSSRRGTRSTPARAGVDLSLTIDAGFQLALEQEVIQAWVADRARSVSAVVMDPYTGEVYAEATYPSYDANDYARIAAADPGRFIDPVVSEVYEPGSVFKMLTVVAGLESGTVTLDTQIDDTGTLELDGGQAKIDDADRKPMGLLSLEDAVAWSRNVVAAKVALNLAPTLRDASAALHAVWRRFGFGSRTGVDVAGEVAGLVRDPASTAWQEIDLANGSFGQGVAVTPLQLAVAFAAMMNGGQLVTPHVVRAIDGVPTATAEPRPAMDASMSTGAHRPHAPRGLDGAVLSRPDAHPRLLRRRQDWHGADLGQRGRGMGVRRLQLLVRRLRRTADRPPGPRHRRPHQRGPPERPTRGPA